MVSDEQKSEIELAYGRYTFRKLLLIFGIICVVIIIAGVSLSQNDVGVGFVESYRYIIDHLAGKTYDRTTDLESWVADYNLWNFRLPRICMAIIVGMGLAACGVTMQALMKNPLADPYTVGISDGACFGAVAAIVVGYSFSMFNSSIGLVSNAFLGGMIPAVVIILLSRFVNMSPATTILVGVALSYIFSGLETAIMVTTDAETLKEAYLWQIGTFNGVSWNDCRIPFVVTAVCGAFLIFVSNKLNLLALGDDSASSLGLDVDTFRTICMIVVSVTVAALVSFVGIIGFVGLVAPHIVRMVTGGDNRYLIPASMVSGAAFMLLADLLSRLPNMYGYTEMELRVGLIVSIIGAPLFLYIIVRRKQKYGEGF